MGLFRNYYSPSGYSQAKRDKLTVFINWPIWAILTKSMLIKKDVWVLISIGPRVVRLPNVIWDRENKEDRMTIEIA